MSQIMDPITFSVPRALLSDISRLSGELTDRLHVLLERNTEGELNPTESAELQTLVQMAQFSQIVTYALQSSSAA